jgi:hypothetical protein
MEAEKAIEIQYARLGAAVVRAGDAKEGAVLVVTIITVRHNHVEAIGSAAQEDADERITAWSHMGIGQANTWHPRGQCHQIVAEEQTSGRLHTPG